MMSLGSRLRSSFGTIALTCGEFPDCRTSRRRRYRRSCRQAPDGCRSARRRPQLLCRRHEVHFHLEQHHRCQVRAFSARSLAIGQRVKQCREGELRPDARDRAGGEGLPDEEMPDGPTSSTTSGGSTILVAGARRLFEPDCLRETRRQRLAQLTVYGPETAHFTLLCSELWTQAPHKS